MKEIAAAYFGIGLVLLIATSIWASCRNKLAFNPVEMLLLDMILALVLWPIWVAISIAEIYGIHIIDKPFFRPLVARQRSEPSAMESVASGTSGVATTALKPFGKVRIADAIYDATTQGEFLAIDTRITVISVTSHGLVVKPEVEHVLAPYGVPGSESDN